MDEEELLLQGDDGAAVITDHLDEEQLLNESINGDAGESAGAVCKIESLDHEELDYEEDEEKEERESRFTSERAKKSPVRAPEDNAAATDAKVNENSAIASRGSYRGRVMRGGAGFRGGMGGNFNMRGGMRMVAGGGSAGPISLLTSNIPPPMMMPGPGMGGPFGKILVNPNFPVGAGLTLLPTPGPGGYGAPPMGLRGPMAPQGVLGPKVTLSIDGAPALAVPVNVPPPQIQMATVPGVSMSMPPPNMSMRPGGQGPLGLNPMAAPPPSAMRFPPGMGPPPMNVGMNVPPPGMAPQMAGGPAGNWNLMVEAFLGDKKAAGERSKKKRRRRSRSSSYSSSSGSESSYSESSRSRSRSRSPRKSRKRSSRGSRKDRRKERSGRGDNKGDRGGERRVFRTGPNAYRINNTSSNGAELPSLLDGIDRGSSGKDSRSRRADRERQREVRETEVESRLKAFREAEQTDTLVVPAPTKSRVDTAIPPPSIMNNFPPPSNLSTHPHHPNPSDQFPPPPQRVRLMDSMMPSPQHQSVPFPNTNFNGTAMPPMNVPMNMPMNSFPNYNGPPMGGQPPVMNLRPGSLLNLKFTH